MNRCQLSLIDKYSNPKSFGNLNPSSSYQTSTMLDSIDRSLRTILEDIATNIQIKGGLEIVHPDYPAPDLPEEFINRIKGLSIELKQKYLAAQLRNFLYSVYYNGSSKPVKIVDSQTSSNWKNSTFLGMDLQFYQQIQANNYGTGYLDRNWQIIRAEADGTLAVKKNGLTIHITREACALSNEDRQLPASELSTEIGDFISVKMPHNLVQNGFYVAVGNAGSYDLQLQALDRMLVRVYFHITPNGALSVMESLTQLLNVANIPFHFKVLYNPHDYNRHDTGVLYIQRYYYPTVEIVLGQIYRKHHQHFQPETPLFTKPIASGLAIAEEPDVRFAESESFGMNRCHIIADGLITADSRGEIEPQLKLGAIVQSFDRVGIDLAAPFLNPGSVDIYASLS
jgi:HopA1 effector protein family